LVGPPPELRFLGGGLFLRKNERIKDHDDGFNLSYANLSGANPKNPHWYGANLSGSRFLQPDVEQADTKNAAPYKG
jgi:uncharacterized protein YjbI with pentapeptide repeats